MTDEKVEDLGFFYGDLKLSRNLVKVLKYLKFGVDG
jgi:hypothetical protein